MLVLLARTLVTRLARVGCASSRLAAAISLGLEITSLCTPIAVILRVLDSFVLCAPCGKLHSALTADFSDEILIPSFRQRFKVMAPKTTHELVLNVSIPNRECGLAMDEISCGPFKD